MDLHSSNNWTFLEPSSQNLSSPKTNMKPENIPFGKGDTSTHTTHFWLQNLSFRWGVGVYPRETSSVERPRYKGSNQREQCPPKTDVIRMARGSGRCPSACKKRVLKRPASGSPRGSSERSFRESCWFQKDRIKASMQTIRVAGTILSNFLGNHSLAVSWFYQLGSPKWMLSFMLRGIEK